MDYYNEIKNELLNNEINKQVKDYSKNKYELEKYYNVGKLLLEAGNKYGEGIIKEYFAYNDYLIFEGEYKNGRRNGKGKEYFNKSKLKFEGEYLNGKKMVNVKNIILLEI